MADFCIRQPKAGRVAGFSFSTLKIIMARRKSSWTGYALVAALVGAGAYFHEQITEYFNKAKGALGAK